MDIFSLQWWVFIRIFIWVKSWSSIIVTIFHQIEGFFSRILDFQKIKQWGEEVTNFHQSDEQDNHIYWNKKIKQNQNQNGEDIHRLVHCYIKANSYPVKKSMRNDYRISEWLNFINHQILNTRISYLSSWEKIASKQKFT